MGEYTQIVYEQGGERTPFSPEYTEQQNNKGGGEQAQFECTAAADENTPKGEERTGGGKQRRSVCAFQNTILKPAKV